MDGLVNLNSSVPRARQPTARIYGSNKTCSLLGFFSSREASGVILAPVLLRWRAVWISRGRVVSGFPWHVKHSLTFSALIMVKVDLQSWTTGSSSRLSQRQKNNDTCTCCSVTFKSQIGPKSRRRKMGNSPIILFPVSSPHAMCKVRTCARFRSLHQKRERYLTYGITEFKVCACANAVLLRADAVHLSFLTLVFFLLGLPFGHLYSPWWISVSGPDGQRQRQSRAKKDKSRMDQRYFL